MSKFAENLKVMFYENHEIIMFDKDNEFTKLSSDSSLYLDLSDAKDTNILNLILKSDKIQIQNNSYKILELEFMLDGTALFVSVEKNQKNNTLEDKIIRSINEKLKIESDKKIYTCYED